MPFPGLCLSSVALFKEGPIFIIQCLRRWFSTCELLPHGGHQGLPGTIGKHKYLYYKSNSNKITFMKKQEKNNFMVGVHHNMGKCIKRLEH